MRSENGTESSGQDDDSYAVSVPPRLYSVCVCEGRKDTHARLLYGAMHVRRSLLVTRPPLEGVLRHRGCVRVPVILDGGSHASVSG